MKEIIQIVKDWLENNGYDGLCHPDYECGCQLNDLMPCGDPCSNCVAGRKRIPRDDEPNPEGYDFFIDPEI